MQRIEALPAGDQNTSNTTGATTQLSAYIGAGNTDPRSKAINATETHLLRNSFTGITAVGTNNGASTMRRRSRFVISVVATAAVSISMLSTLPAAAGPGPVLAAAAAGSAEIAASAA